MSDKQHRVMVIDDSKTIRNTTEGYLRELGHECMCCTDGINGLSHVVSFSPDIFFIDVDMPRLDGLQTARVIRGNQQFKSTPIVMLSSKDGMFDMAMATEAGASDYIVKPPMKEAIAAVIKKHLG